MEDRKNVEERRKKDKGRKKKLMGKWAHNHLMSIKQEIMYKRRRGKRSDLYFQIGCLYSSSDNSYVSRKLLQETIAITMIRQIRNDETYIKKYEAFSIYQFPPCLILLQVLFLSPIMFLKQKNFVAFKLFVNRSAGILSVEQ